MSSFREQQEKITDFITNNYSTYLPQGTNMPAIINDVLDFDKYKQDFCLFLDFARIDFTSDKYSDDCGETERLSLTIYLVRRNGPPAELNDGLTDAAYALYRMIRDHTGLGAAAETAIESIDFFRYVEGTKYLVCSEFDLSLLIEV